MSGGDDQRTRREYLRAVTATGLAGLAGCSGLGGDSESTDSDEPTESPTPSQTETPVTSTPTPEETATPEPDNAPTLATATATPQDNGEALAYQVVAEDDNGLQYVAVTYGDQAQEWEDLGRSIDETGQLTDLGQPPEEGQVAFIARDTAGQETREQRYPDQNAPTLAQFAAEPTENAGEIALTLQGEDDVGLEQLALLLDENPQLQRDVSRETEASVDTTVDVSDNATVGEKNTLTAALEDWNGNTTQTDSDTYVRKFDIMEDTRLSFGGVYQSYFNQFNNSDLDMTGREPTIGQYEVPYDKEIFKRHIDQMIGFGINRITIETPGHEHTREQNRRFLNALDEMGAEVEIDPFYTVGKWFWEEGYEKSAESYRDLVEDHMGWIRDHVLARDDVTRYDGRPVMQMWNPNRFGLDHVNQRIMDEYGSYESFVDDVRDKLTVNGKDPFLVGGANWLGEAGYSERYEEIHSQFDAVTTWVASGLWSFSTDEDGEVTWDKTETTQEEVLDYVERNWQGHREFTDGHDMEFVPMVFPGFNEMKDPQRRHPRSPEFSSRCWNWQTNIEQQTWLTVQYTTTGRKQHTSNQVSSNQDHSETITTALHIWRK